MIIRTVAENKKVAELDKDLKELIQEVATCNQEIKSC